MKHGKKYKAAKQLVEAGKLYDPAEAVELCAVNGGIRNTAFRFVRCDKQRGGCFTA